MKKKYTNLKVSIPLLLNDVMNKNTKVSTPRKKPHKTSTSTGSSRKSQDYKIVLKEIDNNTPQNINSNNEPEPAFSVCVRILPLLEKEILK